MPNWKETRGFVWITLIIAAAVTYWHDGMSVDAAGDFDPPAAVIMRRCGPPMPILLKKQDGSGTAAMVLPVWYEWEVTPGAADVEEHYSGFHYEFADGKQVESTIDGKVDGPATPTSPFGSK